MLPPEERLRELAAFMAERHAVYMRKAWLEETDFNSSVISQSKLMYLAWGSRPRLGPEAWTLGHLTDDPILARYRFCNVYRELDRVTVWIRENIREPYADHPHLWFMLCVARHFNWPETLADLIDAPFEEGSWPSSPLFCPEGMTDRLQRRQARGDKVYTGAYMIRAEQHDRPWRHWPKVRYSAEIVLGRLWEDRERFVHALKPGKPCYCQAHLESLYSTGGNCSDCLNTGWERPPATLEDIWALFQDPLYVGWGPFMAQQVVADLRWTRYLRNAPDVGDWTAVGPGSARGLNRLHGRSLNQAVGQEQGLEEMRAIRAWMRDGGLAAYPWLDVPELGDVQSCLCEVDKYWRVMNNEGRPRALYVPGRGA